MIGLLGHLNIVWRIPKNDGVAWFEPVYKFNHFVGLCAAKR